MPDDRLEALARKFSRNKQMAKHFYYKNIVNVLLSFRYVQLLAYMWKCISVEQILPYQFKQNKQTNV